MELEPAVAVELLKLHHQSVHQTHATGGSTAEDSRKKVKFPKPAVDQVQSLEEWETFVASPSAGASSVPSAVHRAVLSKVEVILRCLFLSATIFIYKA